MKISSDALVKHVPRTAPEGLINHAICSGLLETATLVYNFEWDWEEGLAAALTEGPRRKVKVVRAVCSECGQAMYFQYAPPGSTNRTYGFITGYEYGEGGELIGDGDHTICPHCGARCIARLASKIGRELYASDEALVMSAGALGASDGQGPKPLVLTWWRLRRKCNRYGADTYTAEPWDAYIFEGTEAQKLSGHCQIYSGTAGYIDGIRWAWQAPKNWHVTEPRCNEIYGLSPELIEQTSLAKSHLTDYMAYDPLHEHDRYPVLYLLLWQRYPQVENLIASGAGHILDALIAKEIKQTMLWEQQNSAGALKLIQLDLTERRPAQMLRLDKSELRRMQRSAWDYLHWDVYVTAKRVGDRLTDEDLLHLHEYGGDDIRQLIGSAPLGKCLRYLLKQRGCLDLGEGIAVEPDLDDEGELYYNVTGTCGAQELADYWRMANDCGWDLNDPAVKWPKNLLRAHDRVTAAYEDTKAERLAKGFRDIYGKLRAYVYVSGGIFIRPARSQKELKREGSMLHHCVGTYGEEHVRGESIFFIRRVAEPGKPWYTLQLDLNRLEVLQNRGLYNCERTPEVAAFENEWLDWLRAGAPAERQRRPATKKKREKIA